MGNITKKYLDAVRERFLRIQDTEKREASRCRRAQPEHSAYSAFLILYQIVANSI